MVGCMSDNLDKLATATGLKRETMVDIAERVKANSAKLAACPRHDFDPVPGARVVFGKPDQYRCQHCGGEVDRHAYYWHEQGRRTS